MSSHTANPLQTGAMQDVEDLADWTLDQPGILYQTCHACNSRWYFQRRFCPHCGADELLLQQASGRGTVYSVSHVHRAPTDALRPYAPYTMLLVDTEEGFRMMAHGAPDLHIDEKVQVSYRPVAGKLIPFFDREPT